MRDITLFLCGDVMTGRGVDQVLPHPSNTVLHEPYVRSAVEYVQMAEKANWPIPKPVNFSYIWGDALPKLEQVAAQTRIVNLETSITTSEDYDCKGINYRMHPANTPCLTAAKIDCCVLANNHVLDWGQSGLTETLDVLHGAGIKTAGAGRNLRDALEPAVIQLGGSRVLVFGFGMTDSGVPRDWEATESKPGVAVLSDPLETHVARLAERVQMLKRPGDIAVMSIHWGSNWGYEIPQAHRILAHKLVDDAGMDLIHGHSSHHPKPMEVYHGKLILYGCGDFLNDYEGISGYEEFRSDLVLMYFVSVDASTGKLQHLEMIPLKIQRFRLNYVSRRDAEWLQTTLTREAKQTATEVMLTANNCLVLRWPRG